VEYKNFFETQAEASMRLNGTVVLYNKTVPAQVLCISEHKGKGTLHIYLDPIGWKEDQFTKRLIPPINHYSPNDPSVGEVVDQWLKQNPESNIIHETMDSDKFNKFRPFRLGMYNGPPFVYYVARQPTRRVEQGLIKPMLAITKLSSTGGEKLAGIEPYPSKLSMYGPEFKACVLGEHPSAHECLEGLLNPKYENKGVAFHREFALLKGPSNTLFLGYKTDVIGSLPNKDFSSVKLSRDYFYAREVVENLRLFDNVTCD
jgi:hypothetical protein